MRSMATYSVRYSKSKIRGQKHPREVVKIERASQTHKSIHNNKRLSTSGLEQPSAREGQATTGHPFPYQQAHNYMLRPISRIQIHSYIYIYIYIYTRTNYHKGPSQTRGRQDETHCPSHRFRCLFFYLL